jgi:hypothetical protein
MRGRLAGPLALTLALTSLTGCGTAVHGHGSYAAAPDGATQVAGPQVVGRGASQVELTPVAALPGKSERTAGPLLRIELRVRNSGTALVRFYSADAALLDARGQATHGADDTDPHRPEGDPACPAFPLDVALGPGQIVLGYVTFAVDPPFQPNALTYDTASWLVGTIARSVPVGAAPRPTFGYHLGDSLIMSGRDSIADPTTDAPPAAVSLRASVLSVADPAAGYDPGDGYRLITTRLQLTNIGGNPYWAVPSASMSVVDTDGHAYEAVSYLDKGLFQYGILARFTTRTGLIGFLVPDRAKIAYAELSLTEGGDAAIGHWQFD